MSVATDNLTSSLDPRTLASIASLELRARLAVEGLMTGMHRSPYQGFSVEFAQHRQYAPGDDIRHLDWKVFGRTDKLYLKQYQKETNLDLVLLVDASGSMAYGTLGTKDATNKQKQEAGDVTIPGPSASSPHWSKYHHASTLAAALAYLALQQQDRVGVARFTDHLTGMGKPSNSRGHWRSIVDQLAQEPLDPRKLKAGEGFTDRPTDLARLFDQVNAKLLQRSLVVLVSDLLDDPDHLERGLARLSHRRHDVIVLQTLDPSELHFNFRGPLEFVGLEAEGRLPLDPAALRQVYLEELAAHQKRVESITRRFQFDHFVLDTSQSIGPPLSRFLARRAAMMSRGN